VFLTAKVTFPAFTERSALTNISPSVALTSAFMAPMACPAVAAGAGVATLGAPVVCRMAAAPLTMSPCAVPPGHPWAARGTVSRKRFLATPMVVRDPSSNARWTVDAVLAGVDLRAAPPLVEAATPRAAIAEARSRRAPVLLSRHVIAQTDFTPVAVEGPAFPRSYVLVSPAYGEATGEVREIVERIREHIRIWLR
jgi:DNA-binding transcriptional LysR family regulator